MVSRYKLILGPREDDEINCISLLPRVGEHVEVIRERDHKFVVHKYRVTDIVYPIEIIKENVGNCCGHSPRVYTVSTGVIYVKE